jgi:lipid-A-disaccharide synthase-like uncharacterized protein
MLDRLGRIDPWLIVGFAGQIVFSMRFLLQWIVSELNKTSVVPTAFWVLSMVGSTILLTYAIHRRDPVFIVGQSTGFLIYARNLYLIRQTRRTAQGA